MNVIKNPCSGMAPAEKLEPQTNFPKGKQRQGSTKRSLTPKQKKRPSHASQERERDTSLGSRLEGKESKEGRKNTPPKLNREKRKKDLNSSPNGDEPESRPKTERMGAGQERSHL